VITLGFQQKLKIERFNCSIHTGLIAIHSIASLLEIFILK